MTRVAAMACLLLSALSVWLLFLSQVLVTSSAFTFTFTVHFQRSLFLFPRCRHKTSERDREQQTDRHTQSLIQFLVQSLIQSHTRPDTWREGNVWIFLSDWDTFILSSFSSSFLSLSRLPLFTFTHSRVTPITRMTAFCELKIQMETHKYFRNINWYIRIRRWSGTLHSLRMRWEEWCDNYYTIQCKHRVYNVG